MPSIYKMSNVGGIKSLNHYWNTLAGNTVYAPPGYATTWFQSSPSTGMNRMKGVGWNGTVFVGNYENTANAAYSTDGITWTNCTMSGSSYWYPMAGSVGGAYITAAYADSATSYTTNGATWTGGSMPSSDNWYVSASNGAGKVMFVTRLNNKLAITSNGSTWTEYSTLPSSVDWQAVGSLGGSNWIVSQSGGTAAATTTNDGASWTSRTLPGSGAANALAGNSSIILAFPGGTSYYYSTNSGSTWSTGTLPISAGTDCEWNGKVFVTGVYSVASGNFVATSPDGLTWTTRYRAAVNNGRDMAYGGAGNNTWVMADGTAANPRNVYSTY